MRTLFAAGTATGLTDRELLERYTARRAEATGAATAAELAFAALVDRHGPMVWGVCRRVLGDTHEAEDAFQATFLVLARKAGSVRIRDSLAPWLHEVACRVALCARAADVRRRRHERRAAERADPSARAPGADDLGPLLHEEIGRLPERY
ncbi:MAG TPA: sigma-70 family RNA polymerase sigma factor, partial [Acidimicrobiales bacterium]|nr:sigma-70 family RNA polymerase sigma factor [Acidimicrobiales bacterium]